MNKELQNIRKLVSLMRNHGVLKLKHTDIELELSPVALFPERKVDPEVTEIKQTPMSYEEFERIALHSAPQ